MFKALKLAASVLALSALAGCEKAPDSSTHASGKSDEDQIRELVQREIEGGTKQDIDITMSIYCNRPDVVLFESGPYVMKGYDKIKAAWEGYFKAFKQADASISDLQVGASGDLGYAFALHNWKFTTHDGQVREDQHRVTHIYKKVDGQWCIIHENDSVPVKIVALDEEHTTEKK